MTRPAAVPRAAPLPAVTVRPLSTPTITPQASARPASEARVPTMAVGVRTGVDTFVSPARTILFLGDSITEGVVVTSAQRYQNLVLDELRDSHSIGYGGFGYIPAAYVYLTQVFTPAGTVTFDLGGFPYLSGPGFRAALIEPTGTMTATVTGTSGAVWFARRYDLGVMRVTVDGGTPIDIDTTGDTDLHDDFELIDFGGSGSHTVVVSLASGSFVMLGGLQVFDGDEDSGVRGIDAGRSGAGAGWFAQGATGGLTYASDISEWSAVADVATVLIGVNDWSTSIAPATFQADLQSVVDSLHDGNPALDVMVIALYEADVAHVVPWSDYVDAMADVATGTPGTGFLDLSAVMPVAGTPEGDASGFYHDGLHPTVLGHQEIAGFVAVALAEMVFPSMSRITLTEYPGEDRVRVDFDLWETELSVVAGDTPDGSLLLESGDDLLTESGDRIMLDI